jgi:hypothetical protein
MGCCYSNNIQSENDTTIMRDKNVDVQIALKFPHIISGITYCNDQKQFIKCNDINNWLYNLYLGKSWTNWQVYNDETGHIGNHHNKKGHCKGIIAWNKERISWLCHSVPNFPRQFSGDSISEIEKGELIYGQSFQYIEFNYTVELIVRILNQVQIMEAHVFIEKNNIYNNLFLLKSKTISNLELTDTITHIAKSPHYHIDIYSDVLAIQYSCKWYVESWIRGHHISDSKSINDIKHIQFEDITYKESQDHSKWATNKTGKYWIGDLNRMSSQYIRGGGGFVCEDADIAQAFYKLIVYE